MKVIDLIYNKDPQELEQMIFNPNHKLVIMLSGPAGVGKSTFARLIMRDLASHGLVGEILSSDSLRWELFHSYDYFEGDFLMWKELYARANQSKHVVILDATYTTIKSRAKALKELKYDYLIGINLSADEDTILARNAARERKVPAEAVQKMCKRNTLFTIEELKKYGYALGINVSMED